MAQKNSRQIEFAIGSLPICHRWREGHGSFVFASLKNGKNNRKAKWMEFPNGIWSAPSSIFRFQFYRYFLLLYFIVLFEPFHRTQTLRVARKSVSRVAILIFHFFFFLLLALFCSLLVVGFACSLRHCFQFAFACD